MNYRTRDYDLEKQSSQKLNFVQVLKHPLTPLTTVIKNSPVIDNPLMPSNDFMDTPSIRTSSKTSSVTTLHSFEDPLSMFQQSVQISEASNKEKTALKDESWNKWKSDILNIFTTNQKVNLEIEGEATVTERVRDQLKQLDALEEGVVKTQRSLSQKEYVEHIRNLRGSMMQAWKEDQRVKTLKVAIQCCKLLSDTSTPAFYPSKFVIIVDILCLFSSLVMHRLINKSIPSSSSSSSSSIPPQDFDNISLSDLSPNTTSEQAKETCRNWLYKVASIRELLPRLFLETSISPCQLLLSFNSHKMTWNRLMTSCRGVSDVMVACYLRCFVVKIIMESSSSSSSSSHNNSDFASSSSLGPPQSDPFTFPPSVPPKPSSLMSLAIQDSIFTLTNHRRISLHADQSYLRLFSPAFDWLFKCYIKTNQMEGNEQKSLQELFALCMKNEDDTIKSLLIGCFIDQSPGSFVSEVVMELLKEIKLMAGSRGLCWSSHDLLCKLGSALQRQDNVSHEHSRQILTDVWESLDTCLNIADYMSGVVIWAPFVANHFGRKEVLVVLKDVCSKVGPEVECNQDHLCAVVLSLLQCRKASMEEIMTSNHFNNYLTLINPASKTDLARKVLKMLVDQKNNITDGIPKITDPVLIHTALSLAKCLHDLITPVSLDDEVRTTAELLVQLIQLVQTSSAESQLAFYVECRGSMCNLDSVMSFLIHKVNQLQMMSPRDASFYRSCNAFTFISIPSLNSPYHKICLSLSSASCALLSGCLSQASDFVEFAIGILTTIPRYLHVDGKPHHTETSTLQVIKHLLSHLIMQPDPPHLPPLSHFKHLYSTILSYHWDETRDTRVMLLLNFLVALCTISQPSYPYHATRVVSNDALYGADPKFLKEVHKLYTEVSQQFFQYVSELPFKKKVTCLPVLFTHIIGHFKSDSEVFKFLLNKMTTVKETQTQAVRGYLLRLSATDPSYQNAVNILRP